MSDQISTKDKSLYQDYGYVEVLDESYIPYICPGDHFLVREVKSAAEVKDGDFVFCEVNDDLLLSFVFFGEDLITLSTCRYGEKPILMRPSAFRPRYVVERVSQSIHRAFCIVPTPSE